MSVNPNYQTLTKAKDVQKSIDYLNESTEVGSKGKPLSYDEILNHYMNKGPLNQASIPIGDISKFDHGFQPRDLINKSAYDQLNEYRADSQSNWNKTGNMLTRGLVKAAISVVEPLGYLLDVEQISTDVNKYEEEYGNWFNNWLIKQEERLDAALPIYTKSNEPTIGSPDWFLKNGDQILKSIGYFVPGMVGTKLAMGAFAALQTAKIIPATIAASRARGVVAPLLSVIAMNYNEHMRSAVEVFKDGKEQLYDKYFNESLEGIEKLYQNNQITTEEYNNFISQASEDANSKAKSEAADEASKLVWKGKANIPLELVEYMTLFKYLGGSRSMKDVAKNSLSIANVKPILADFLKSGGSEYLQEVNTGYFEKEAARNIKLSTNQIEENPNEDAAGRYLEHLASYEGLTEGLSGMLGGSGMQALSTIMAHKSRNVARDIQREISSLEEDAGKFNKIQRADLLDLLQRAAVTGKSANAIETFNAIGKMTAEEAAALNLDENYTKKAAEYSDIATEFEKSFNDLSIIHQEDPIARNVLLNRRMNSYLAVKDLIEVDAKLAESKAKYSKDQISDPTFEIREVDAKLSSLNQLISDNSKLLEELDDKFVSRTLQTNETASEIEARTKRIYSIIGFYNNKKLELANKYLTANYKKPEAKDGVAPKTPEFILTKGNEQVGVTEDGTPIDSLTNELSLINSDDQSLSILKELNSKLQSSSINDNEYFGLLANSEYLKSIRDSSFNAYKDFLAKPDELKKIIKDVQTRTATERDLTKSKIKAASLRELDKLKSEITDPELLKYIGVRQVELTKLEADIAKENAARAKANADAIRNKAAENNATPPVDPVIPPTKPLTYDDIKSVNDRLVGEELNKAELKLKDLQLPVVTNTDSSKVPVEKSFSFTELNTHLGGYDKAIAVNASRYEQLIKDGNIHDAMGIQSTLEKLSENRHIIHTERLNRIRNNETGTIADAMVKPQLIESAESLAAAKNMVETKLISDDIAILESKNIQELEEQLGLLTLKKSIIKTDNHNMIIKRPDVEGEVLKIQAVDLGIIDNAIANVKAVKDSIASSFAPIVNDVKNTPIFEEVNGQIVSNKKLILGLSDTSIPRVIFARTNKNRILQDVKLNNRSVNTATSAAYLDMNYAIVNDPEFGEPIKYTIENENIKRNSFIKTLVDDPDTQIRYVIDRDSPYHKKVVEQFGLGTDGYVREAPIKIQAKKNGEWIDTDTWIHRASWVDENTKELRPTEENPNPNNIETQKARILGIRKKVFDNDANSKESLAKVTSVSMGKANFNVKFEKTYKDGVRVDRPVIGTNGRPVIESLPVKDALPGLESFAIMDSGILRSSKNEIVSGSNVLTTLSHSTINGMLFGIHNDPLSNKKIAIPLSSATLGTTGLSRIKNALINAVKNFNSLTPSSGLGFVAGDNSTLNSYLSKFIHLTNYKPKLSSDYTINKSPDGIMIAEPRDSEVGIAYSISNSSGVPVVFKHSVATGKTVVGQDEKSISEFYDKLGRVLNNTGLSVNLDLLNSTTPYEVPIVTNNFNDSSIKYDTYSDLLKGALKTIFNGRTKLDNGKYTVLTQNDVQTVFEDELESSSLDESKVEVSESGDITVKGDDANANIKVQSLDELLDLDQDFRYSPAHVTNYDKQFEYSELYDKLLPEFRSNIIEQEHFVGSILNNIIRLSLDSIYEPQKNININKSLDLAKSLDIKELNAVQGIVDTTYEVVSTVPKYAELLKRFNIKSQEDAIVRLAAFEKLINNWEALAKLALVKLDNMNLLNDELDINLEDDNNFYERSQYNNKLRLQVNPSSYSNKLKIRLANVPLMEYTTDDKGIRRVTNITNSLGRPVYAEVETLYNTILELLSDTVITIGDTDTNLHTSVNEYVSNAIDVLNKHSVNYPTLQGVIELLTTPYGIFEDIINNDKLSKEEKSKQKELRQKDYLQSTRTLFTNATLNTKIRFKKILLDRSGGTTTAKSIFINEVGGYKGVISNWNHHQRRLGLIEGSGDNMVINKELINSIKNELNELVISELNNIELRKLGVDFINPKFLNNLAKVFGKLGLLQSDRSLIDNNSLLEFGRSSIKSRNIGQEDMRNWLRANLQTEDISPNSSNTIMSKLFNHLLSDHTKLDYTTDNVFNFGELFPSFIKPLAQAVYNNNEMAYSLVSIDAEGNIIYEIQKYNSLMSLVRDIKDNNGRHLDNLLNVPFSNGNPLIIALKEDPITRANFDISFYDSTVETFNTDGKSKKSVEDRQNIFMHSQLRTAINIFQSSPINPNSNINFAEYLGLTLGDNPISFIMNSVRKPYVHKYLKNTSVVPRIIYTDIYSRVTGEIKRIHDFNKLKESGVVFNNPKYNKHGDKFVMFNYLNRESIGMYLQDSPNVTIQNKIDELYIINNRTQEDIDAGVPEYKLNDSDKATNYIKEAIANHFNASLKEFINTLKEANIIKEYESDFGYLYSTDVMDSTYLNAIHQLNVNNSSDIDLSNQAIAIQDHYAIKSSILDYFANSYIANADMHVLFANDLAHYAESDSFGNLDLIKTNAGIQKRLRQLVTPFIRGNYAKEYSSVININDIILKSELKDLQARGYLDFNIDDGLELATVREMLHDQLAYDQIKQSQFDKLIKKLDDPNYSITDKDLELIDVKKPISWDNNTNLEHGTIYPHRIKSSRLYLDPAITKDFPALDKLRIFMESRNIDRAVFQSGVKVTSTRVLPVFNKDGSFNENAISEYDSNVQDYRFDQTYDNTGLVTLQPNSKTKVSNLIQVDRGLFTGIRDISNFEIRVFEDGKYVTKVMNGYELEALKSNIRIAQLKLGKKQLIDEFGITIDAGGKLKFSDFKKLHKILSDEGYSRKWVSNSINLLALNQDNKFELPLHLNNNLKRIESVLFSVINKKLVKHKITGGSWVQVPNIGHTKKDTRVISLEDASKDIKSSIIYVDGYTRGSKLNFISKSKDTVKRAQIIVSWNFRDSDNNLLDIEDYVIEKDGKLVIDYERLPKELLEGIAMRIPNQKHSSMLPFEIVGFLPTYHKDTVIVPNEIVVQMGSDFDIDKLYSYLYDYYHNPNTGVLKVIRRDDELLANKDELLNEANEFNKLVKEDIESVKADIKEFFKDLELKNAMFAERKKLKELLNLLDSPEDISKTKDKLNKLKSVLKDPKFKDDTDFALYYAYDTRLKELLSRLDKSNKLKNIINNRLVESAFLNNEYIDIHNSVLTHPEVYPKVTAKLDFTDLADAVKELGKSELVDVLNPTYQMRSYISQYAGKRLLSTLSLHVSMLGLVEGVNNGKLNSGGVYLREFEGKKEVPVAISIFKGYKLNFLNGIGNYTYKGDPRTNHDTLVILQNASVDNANNPLLGYANLNNYTIGPAILLAYLKQSTGESIGITEIVKFVNQPIIKEFVRLVDIKSNESSEVRDHIIRRKAYEELIQKYSTSLDADGNVRYDEKGLVIPISLEDSQESFTNEELTNMINEVGITDQYRANQVKILMVFDQLHEYFKTLDNSRRALLNPAKDGLGSSYSTVLYQKTLIDMYLKKNNHGVANLNKVYYENKKFTQSGYFVNEAINVFGEGVADIFNYNYDNLARFIESSTSMYNINDLSANVFDKLLTHFRKASYSSNSMLYGESLNNLRGRLVFGENSLVKRIEQLKSKILNNDPDVVDLYNNKFLQALSPQANATKFNIDLISHAFMSKVGIDPESTTIAISQLLSHPNKEVRDIGIDLVKYTFAFGQPTSANYQQDISFNYLKAVGFFDNIRDTEIDHTYMFKNYIQHHPYESMSINPNAITMVGGTFENTTGYKNDLKLDIVTKFTIPTYDLGASGKFKYIYNQGVYHLYERVSVVPVSGSNGQYIATYIKIPTLGSINYSKLQFMEGDYKNPNGISSFPFNNIGIDSPIVSENAKRVSNSEKIPNTNTEFSNNYLNGNKTLAANLVLDKIPNNSSAGLLAEYLSKVISKMGVTLPIYENNTMNAFGSFHKGKIEINAYLIKAINPNVYEQTLNKVIVHEVIHGITDEKFRLFERGELDKLTTSEKAAIRKFNDLREYTINLVKNSPRYQEVENAINKYLENVNKTNAEPIALTPEQRFQYHLRSNSEFLTGILTDESTQEMLNKLQYVGKKTMLQELKELLYKLVEHFINSLGITVKDNSILKEGIIQSFEVIDALNKLEPSENKSSLIKPVFIESSTSNYNRSSVENDKNTLYIFTDNTDRTSGTNSNVGGWYAKKYGNNLSYGTINNPTSAVIRGLDNAYPISTMRLFSRKHFGDNNIQNLVKSRWTDSDFIEFKSVIDSEVQDIINAVQKKGYTKVVIPKGDGFFNSTIANITIARTPKLYEYLKNKLTELKNELENPNTNEGTQLKLFAPPVNDNFDLYSDDSNSIPSPFEKMTINQQVAFEKTIRDVAARMSDRIGIDFKITNTKNDKFKGRLIKNLGRWGNPSGNTEYIAEINLAYATLDTPIHEILGHPIIRAIKNRNSITEEYIKNARFGYELEGLSKNEIDKKIEELKNQSKNQAQLYQNLLKELETGRGKEVLDRIKKDYQYKYNVEKTNSDYGNYKIKSSESGARYFDTFEEAQKALEAYAGKKYTLEEQQEEAIVELLGLMTADKLDIIKDSNIISLLKQVLNEIKQFVRRLLLQREVNIDNLPDNMTIGDIADLLAYSSNKLILPGHEVIYTTPDNMKFKTYQEASNHISQLAKSVEDVDLDNVSLAQKQNLKEVTSIDEIPVSEFKVDNGYGDFLEFIKINDVWYGGGQKYSNIVIISNYNNSIKQKSLIDKFIEKNKKYEQSKEIIEEWKRVNNIQYNPEEVYSRGQEFVSVVGAYSNFDVNLMMQNLLQHIEDNQKAGGEFTISAFTKPVDKKIGHLEGDGGKIKFKIYPQSEDILWAANTDVYSGSIWDASEKVNKDKKSELLGVSYTKYPSLNNVDVVQPNLASIVDDLAHHHNELGISLTGNNFRLEYDEDIPYQTKKIINGINSILDQRYGKLIKPEIKNSYDVSKRVTNVQNIPIDEFAYYDHFGDMFYYKKENDTWYVSYTKKAYDNGDKDLANLKHIVIDYNKFINNQKIQGIQPTQTNDNLKESIESVKNKLKIKGNANEGFLIPAIEIHKNNNAEVKQIREIEYLSKAFPKYKDDTINIGTVEFGYSTWYKDGNFYYVELERNEYFKVPVSTIKKILNESNKEYTDQALINIKIAALKEVAKKYPRSLIRSEVKKVSENNYLSDSVPNFESDDFDFQKIPNVNNDNIEGFKEFVDASKLSDMSSLGKLDGDLMKSEKGQIGVNKQQLLMLLGPTMYNKPLAQVAVKELLQNSFDAVKARQNISDNKETGNIEIKVDYDNRTISIIDDGIGMTPDIVKNAFLSIGGTNKEGLDVSERSGGFGLAKVQFLLGSEYVKVATVRDGIKTTLEASAIQLYNDDFEIFTESTNEPNGSIVEVKIPQSYITPEGVTRSIDFPGTYSTSYKSFHILDNPLIGDVSVKFTYTKYKNSETTILPIGVNSNETTIPPLFSKIDFAWGSADLYMSIEKKERPTHKILSSGIYQFNYNFNFKDWESIPYDIVVNIKPSVSSTSEQYPFNNQRENFKNTISEDIKALNNYLKRYALGEADKTAKAVFSNITGLPKVDPNKVLTPEEREKLFSDVNKTIEENKQRRINEGLESVEEAVRKVYKLIIDKDGVKDKDTGVVEISKEKKYNTSFKSDREIEKVKSIDSINFNPTLPQYHNNTNIDYLKIPGATEFFSDFGSVVLEMVRFAGNELGYNYDKLKSENEKFFAGVSIDREYGGVHLRKIINAIFINPLAFDVYSLEEAVGVALHVVIHEINHTTVSGEGAEFTTALGILYGKIYGTGKYGLYEGLFRSVYKKHFETFKILKNEYDKSSTRNLSESFKAERIQRGNFGNVQGDVSNVSTRQSSEDGNIGNSEHNSKDRTGDVILSNIGNEITDFSSEIFDIC